MTIQKRCALGLIFCGLLIVTATNPVAAQQRPGEKELKLRVYQLSDLVLPIPGFLRNAHQQSGGSIRGGAMGMGGGAVRGGMGGGAVRGGMGGGMGGFGDFGGGGGGGQGGGGGGQFNVAQFGGGEGGGALPGNPNRSELSTVSNSPQFTLGQLMETIQSVVDPSSWDTAGGPGSMRALGTMLLVTQTPQAHTKIHELLDAIRLEGGKLQSVTIEARWLLLDSDQLSELRATSPSSRYVNREALERFTRSETSYRGQVTCFSGQTIRIEGGEQRSVITSVIPVVGSGVGYQPVIQTVHVGASLTVQPMLLQDKNAAILNLKSSVVDMKNSPVSTPLRTVNPGGVDIREGVIQSKATAEKTTITAIDLDKINIIAQEMATSVRVPLDQPILVGGMTLTSKIGKAAQTDEVGKPSNATDDPQGLVKKLVRQGERRQLYLIVEVTVDPGEQKPSDKGE